MRRVDSAFRTIRTYLPPLNFITVHYLYFITTTLITSVIFYCISTPAWSISYVDCLFLQVSAMTEAGLNTYNLSEMNTVQQIMLFVQIMCGSAIFVSIFVVQVRKRAFENRFADILEEQRQRRKDRSTSGGISEYRSRSTVNLQHSPQQLRERTRAGVFDHKRNECAVEDALESSRRLSGVETLHAQDNGPCRLGRRDPDRITFADTMEPDRRVESTGLKHRTHPQIFSFSGVGASPTESTIFRRPGSSEPQIHKPRSVSVSGDQSDWREILGRA